jgi:thiamine pyrophosphate-dependent acetolactate synthase large subunit-like protein
MHPQQPTLLPGFAAVAQQAAALRQPVIHITIAPPAVGNTQEDCQTIQDLKAQLAAAQQQLHSHASQAWLQAEAAWQQQRKQQLAQRRTYADTAYVRDNTLPQYGPDVIATGSTVHLKQPLDPIKAVPIDLPWLSLLRNWVMRKPQ